MEFSDAIIEGRGMGNTEAFNMLYQHDYALSPMHAAQLLYGQSIKIRGIGKNIPNDLHMKHLNHLVKESINALESNKTEYSIVRVSKALGTIVPIIDNFDDVRMLIVKPALKQITE